MLLDVLPPTIGPESHSLVLVLAILAAVAAILLVRRGLRGRDK
ncbi:MAG: hypothetical protein R3F49_03440 [Planctomycetota bacterium]